MVEMVGSGIRKGIKGVPIWPLVLLMLGVMVIISLRSTMGLRHKKPNFGPVDLNQPHHILLVGFMVSYIMVSVMR